MKALLLVLNLWRCGQSRGLWSACRAVQQDASGRGTAVHKSTGFMIRLISDIDCVGRIVHHQFQSSCPPAPEWLIGVHVAMNESSAPKLYASANKAVPTISPMKSSLIAILSLTRKACIICSVCNVLTKTQNRTGCILCVPRPFQPPRLVIFGYQ